MSRGPTRRVQRLLGTGEVSQDLLDAAAHEADLLEHPYVGLEHLRLAGLRRDGRERDHQALVGRLRPGVPRRPWRPRGRHSALRPQGLRQTRRARLTAQNRDRPTTTDHGAAADTSVSGVIGTGHAAEPSRLGPAGRVLVHQIHPVKLGVDIGAALVSNALLSRGRLRAGLLVRTVAPVLGSAAVLATADLDSWAGTRRGTYVLTHMPPAAQALRLASDAVLGIGAARHCRPLMALGVLGIVAGWSAGLLPETRRPDETGSPG